MKFSTSSATPRLPRHPTTRRKTRTTSVLDHHHPSVEESGVSMLSKSMLRMKVCLKCAQESPYWYATCPNCGEKLEN